MILKEHKTANYIINIVFITFLLLICFLAFSSNQGLSISSFQYEDKIQHILAFFFLSFFLQISFKSIKAALKFFALSIFALLIEVGQHYVGRQANLYDFFSSILGVFLFFIVYRTYKKL